MKINNKTVTESFINSLITLARSDKNFVVLDADLSDDLNLKRFSDKFPNRFIQNGIAEQDMVSMAGGIARMGLLPVVNSFASFLTARGNEQIYNNSTEQTKIIYLSLYAGAIPAGAGKSHQSLRDISLLSNIPNIRIFHPYDEKETNQILRHCLSKKEKNNCAIRLSIGPIYNTQPKILSNYKFRNGKGNQIVKGKHAIIFTYGQTMINEAFKACKILEKKNFKLEIINMSCLNYFDKQWIRKKIKNFKNIFILDDHNVSGGMGDLMISYLADNKMILKKNFNKLGFKDFPACGTHYEVLKFHELDCNSLARKILKVIK